MGEVDLHRIYPIYRYLVDHYPKFKWEIDSGKMETVVAIHDDGRCFRPQRLPEDEPHDWRIFVPDILCWYGQVVIEYQEQPKPKKHRGRLSKKGHTEFSDETKDFYYDRAGLKQIKIWDDDPNWKRTLDLALIEFL